MGQVFIKTRKRDPEKKYKTPTEVVQLKIVRIYSYYAIYFQILFSEC